MQKLFYFNIGVLVTIMHCAKKLDEAPHSETIPINVVLELKENSVFTLENMELAKSKALMQLGKMFEHTKLEDYLRDADFVIPALMSISFLGSSTHNEFMGHDFNKDWPTPLEQDTNTEITIKENAD